MSDSNRNSNQSQRKKFTHLLTQDYIDILDEIGYHFRMNALDQSIEVNGVPMTDAIEAMMRMELRDRGVNTVDIARDAWTTEALNHDYHPIVEYLGLLDWNGEDHISKLASYFTDEHNIFPLYLRKWLVGAVARVFTRGRQNRVLVLDGKQSLGKSHFARWLTSTKEYGLRRYTFEGPIFPDQKDSRVRLMNTWIWEISELGGTIRKSDKEMLKQFFTIEMVTDRRPYARYDTQSPAMTSFIATVNDESGFFDDPTGLRRYMTTTLTSIDWNYSQEVDVDQVWAQARALYDQDYDWNLDKDEFEFAQQINSTYSVQKPTHGFLDELIERDETSQVTSEKITLLIMERHHLTSTAASKELASYMNANGYGKSEALWFTVNGVRKKLKGYRGVRLAKPYN